MIKRYRQTNVILGPDLRF